ncbi:Histone deacetylase 2 [Cladochytrium tenue]|nr:Histone deacetylase 2 [Cladochytrium tenue]
MFVLQELPVNDYIQYYGPDFKLDVPSSNMENLNTRAYLDKVIGRVIDNLRHMPHAPSVQSQEVPNGATSDADDDEVDDRSTARDVRISEKTRDRRVVPDNELSDSDADDDAEAAAGAARNGAAGRRRDRRSHREQDPPAAADAPPVPQTDPPAQAASETVAAGSSDTVEQAVDASEPLGVGVEAPAAAPEVITGEQAAMEVDE